MLAANFGFYSAFKPMLEPSLPPKNSAPFDFGTPDGYEFYLRVAHAESGQAVLKGSNPLFNDQLLHTTYDDYWKARDLSRHMKNIKCAVMTVGGWFDEKTFPALSRRFTR